MILDLLSNAGLYTPLGERIAAGLRFLSTCALAELPPGRHPVAGDDIYALVQEYETKDPDRAVWEAHRRYIDIQYMLKGSERIGWANINDLDAGPYNDEKDYLHLKGEGGLYEVRQGMFMLLMPQDAHMPGLALAAPMPVRKVVVKVRI